MHTLTAKGAVMWEIEIICSRKNSTYISFIQEGIVEVLAENGGVSAISADCDTVSLSIGCKKQNSVKVKAILKILLVDVVCEKIKFDFLQENLDATCLGQEYVYALAKVCTYFDNELDRHIVLQSLDINSDKLNIESFFCFRLIALKNKWLELCKITSGSKAIVSPENFVELVQFLLSNIETKSQSVILEMQEKCIIYHDSKKDFDIISAIDPLDKFLVLGKLIELNPMIIKIYASKDSDETLKLVKNVFADKVIVN